MVPAVSAFLFELLPDSSSDSGTAPSTMANHVVANGDSLHHHSFYADFSQRLNGITYELNCDSTNSTQENVGIADRANPTAVSDCFEFIAPAGCLNLWLA